MAKTLSYEEFIQYAKDHYDKGGDGYYECWDRMIFDEYVKEFGGITKRQALGMFRMEYSIRKEYEATAW